jgi:peptidoglycan/LPS O-acetylase OafA/YrhL
VQGLRAIAVILVILDHARVPGFEGGYVGVDVFFVISGFVITGLLHRQPTRHVVDNLRHFYSRRVRRIVPAATVVLVATTIVAYVALRQNTDPSLFGDVRWAALFAANFRFISTSANYFVPGLQPSLVNHFWSLAVEEQFYLAFPLVVFSLTWLTPARLRTGALSIAILAGIGASAWWSAHLTAVDQVTAYYSPFTRFWEIALGGLIAVLPVGLVRRTPRLNTMGSLIALVVIGVSVGRLNEFSAYPGTLAWWPCGATAILLLTGAHQTKWSAASALSLRPARYIGDISYSLYLYHFAWLLLPLELVHPPSAWWSKWAEIGGAVTCAVISYHLLENPIRRSKRLAGDGVATTLLLAVCVAASIATTLVVAHWVSTS